MYRGPNLMPEFVPGLELARAFYEELVEPILAACCPGLGYSMGLLGSGSEVLGYDSQRSTDHHWGPRLQLFLDEADRTRLWPHISDQLTLRLPTTFRGYSTNFGPPDAIGVRLPLHVEQGPIAHRVEPYTPGAFLCMELGFDPHASIDTLDWLLMPSQRLLHVTAGAVFHDGLGELEPIRATLRWYPHDVWLYLIACQWKRIAQEEAFVGRCGEAGDDLSSRIVAGRLVWDLMRLCFLLERRYAPYSKWLGTAFASLSCGPELQPVLLAALAADEWHERERQLCLAYELVGRLHNSLEITSPVDPSPRPYYNRPYQVLGAERFVEATRRAIQDERLRALRSDIGAIDQFADSTDLLQAPALVRGMRSLYP
ncbi:MAG: DUF4037 domain-containing protein [Dehalococcoidia bacterium]